MSTIKLDQVSKIYNSDGSSAIGIQNISVEMNLGEFVAITGESGSGKSTFLNVVSMMDTYEEGELFINDKSTVEFSKADFANYRANYVSFIFQEYNLVDSFTVLENVMLPLIARGYKRKDAKKIAKEAISKVGLDKVVRHKATHLSGGEKQRTVIARALVSDTPIIACDEPTGNLDSETAKQIINLLHEVASNKLILFVTHDYNSISHVATRHIVLKDSHLESDTVLSKPAKVEAPEIQKKKKASPLAITAIGFKDVIATPKKSTLSFLISLLISLSSVAILAGAYSLITPAQEQVTTVTNTYAEANHSKNRVAAFGTGKNGAELKDFTVDDDVFVDVGNIISSQYQATITANSFNFECSEINLLHEGDTLIKIDDSRAPEGVEEIALGVSKKEYNSYVSKTYANDYFRNKFLNINQVTMTPVSVKNTSYKFKPVGVYLIDNDDEFRFSVIMSQEGLKSLRSKIYSVFKSSSKNINEYARDPYLSEATYSVAGANVAYNVAYDSYLRDSLDYTKIYLPTTHQGFDLTISFRYSTIIVPTEDIVYIDNLPGIIIHQPAFIRYFVDNYQMVSYFSPTYRQTEYIVNSLLSNEFISYRASNPQSSEVKISENGYQNLLMIIGYAAIFVSAAILIAFLGSLILGVIYHAQKKDYAIYSSLSFSRKNIRVINLVEISVFFVITSLLSYFLVFGLSGQLSDVFGNLSLDTTLPLAQRTTFEGLATTLSSLYQYVSSPLFILIYFGFNVLFAFLVSTWIMNKFDRKTLANNLRKGGELL